MRFQLILPLALLTLGGAAAVFATQTGDDDRRILPPQAKTPWSETIALVEAHPFTLFEPEPNWMRPGAPEVDRGLLLVLETDPDLLVRRQSEEHVLYVGDEPVQRFNNGDRSGRLVVLAPGDTDLAQAPVYFGSPALPERLTDADRAAELDTALASGVRAFGPDAIAEALAPAVELADGYELGRYASYLIEAHSPLETDVVSGLRAERIGR